MFFAILHLCAYSNIRQLKLNILYTHTYNFAGDKVISSHKIMELTVTTAGE